jgi:hypothetical protein
LLGQNSGGAEPLCARRRGRARSRRGYPQLGQRVCMCRFVGREIDREPALTTAAVRRRFSTARIVTEDGLVGESDRVLAGGGDELLEARAVDLRTVSRQVACWA